jgi:hypothetical protein
MKEQAMDRHRHHDQKHDEEPFVEEIIPAGMGAPLIAPDTVDEEPETPAEHALHEQGAGDAPENDDELLEGHSPEFQRLTKPANNQS